jgi:hypothetical protein
MSTLQPRDRCEIDDRAAAAFDHFGNGIFRHQHHRGDIDAHRAIPGVDVDLDGVAARTGNADIVDENVEPAPGLHRAHHDRLARRRIAHIAFDDLRDAALDFDQSPGFFRPLRNHIHQHHTRAVPRKNHRGGAAVADTFRARAGAGNDGDLAFEAVVAANVGHRLHDVRFNGSNRMISAG